MQILEPYSDLLAGEAVIAPDADKNTIVNIVVLHAAASIQRTHDSVETGTAMFQPFLDDLDIHHQRHGFVDMPLIVKARDALVTANDLLNRARSRLTAIRADIAPGRTWNLYEVLKLCLALQFLLQRANAENREILQLFRQVWSTTHVFGNTVRTTFPSQIRSNTQENRDFIPEQDEENSHPRMNA